jgi:hypothetical protein
MRVIHSALHASDLVSFARLPGLGSSLLAMQLRQGYEVHAEPLDGPSPRPATVRRQMAERLIVISRHSRRPSPWVVETVPAIWRSHWRATILSMTLKAQPPNSTGDQARSQRCNRYLQRFKCGEPARHGCGPRTLQSSVGVYWLCTVKL